MSLQFQSTLPRGERRWELRTGGRCTTDFNPRSRVGSDKKYLRVETLETNFNPRSRVGSDGDAYISAVCQWDFNPRSRVGSDSMYMRCLFSMHISIHAPAWGATCYHDPYERRHSNFNPRSRVGSDPSMIRTLAAPYTFQSTLPRGERPANCASTVSDASFQSTLPRGERQRGYGGGRLLRQFQSTLPRGERLPILSMIPYVSRISIHAPAWGATRHKRDKRGWIKYFNPRSRVGSDVSCWMVSFEFSTFQSTLPRGERRQDTHNSR